MCLLTVAALAVVVCSESSEAVQRTAARELEKFLGERLGGQALTVEGLDDAVFHVGDTAFARAKGLSPDSFQDEEWAVKSFGRDVVLAGGGRGVLYAVYHFLEDDCGIGFFGNDDTEIPSGPLALGKIDRRGRPHFRYRCIHRGLMKNLHPEFVARRRLNSNSELGAIPAAFGGDVAYGPPNHVHTYDAYLPEAKYFKEHPEYYALKDGVRWPGKTGQLCLANPDVRRILREGLLDYIARGEAKAREAGQPPPRFYELSMNDNWRRCECEACKAECEKYNPSGQQIRLMNELAAAIREKYPYVILTTLAYFYSEPPPKGGVKAADNVLVKLCDTRTNSASGIFEDENAFFRELVEGWRKCVGEFIVWDYAIVYDDRTKSFPFPSENTFGDFFRYMADQRAYGFFIEQEKSDVSDQYELKLYLQSQLMENPYADAKDLYWTFMSRYYGKAAASVHEARRRLAQSARERHAYVDWLANVGAFDFLTEEDTAFMRGCYDRAEKAVAGEPKRLARVRKSRRGVDDLSRVQAEAPKPNKDGVFVLEGDLISLPSRNAVARVDDPDSPSGKAVRCLTDESKGRYFDPPVVWGMYDVSKKTTLESGRIEIPSERGYRWHDLGEHTFPGSGYMYFTRGWPVQICPAFPGIAGKRFNVRALIRFVGPVYHPGETGKSWIDFARFELSPVTSGSAVAASAMPGEPVLESPAETSIGVAWAVPGLSIGFVELADNPEMRNAVLVRDAAPVAMLDDQSVSVRLTGLKPATRYWYRTVTQRIVSRHSPLYADIAKGEFVRGRVHSFATCGSGAKSAFAVINDTHADWKSFALTAARLKRVDSDVFVWNGDATNCTEEKRTAVDVILRPAVPDSDYAADRAVLWVNGNHDFEGAWMHRFGEVMLERLPEERSVRDATLARNFAVRQGDIALIGLDTGEALTDDDRRLAGRGNFAAYRARQTAWLEDQFKRPEIASAPYVVAFCHIPIFEERPGAVERDLTHALKGGCNAWCRPGFETWGKVLSAHGVQLVVSGHEHQYRIDRAKDGRTWDQLVGGGPELGIPSRSDGDTYFPTVIEGSVRDGRLHVAVHDVWRDRTVATFDYQPRGGLR